MCNHLKNNSFSTFLDFAEIFYARYRDKSDLFDVYCKSSNIKVYFLQFVRHVLLFSFN